ncbi:hypothetical protein [Mycolicibacterium palauense]|uniref:hypothetical protein n=1 Tax=Mycolicibacterium palauense TaxID=2034511 RepID=UPI000BFEC2A7|nr:hypothetical protein [Mycolicibacterium palauense]
MNDIDRWFARAARRETRSVSLYSSLLTGRIFAYLRYRLRYSLILDTARFAVHVIEFLILLSSLGGLAALTVMMLRIGGLIVGGGWWGLLEVMRERLRTFSRTGDRESSEREIGRWLVLAGLAAALVAAGAGLALVVLRPSGPDPIAHLYAFLVVLEVAIGLPVRVLHSGIYATRRVYRPIWSMFAPTIVQLAVLTAGFYFYPTAAMILAITVSNAIGIWITVHFSLEVYRLIGLRPRYRHPDRASGAATTVTSTWAARAVSRTADAVALWRFLPSIPPRLGLETTLAGLGLRLDAVIVLAIAGIYGTSTRSFEITAGVTAWRDVDAFQFFYLVLPLFRGSYEASGLFYFDFVRLRAAPALREFRILFFHRLLWTTPVIGLFFWGLAAALGLLVMPDIPFSFLAALVPLFLVRTVAGVYQMRLFAEGHFTTLIATIVLLGGLLWLVWLDTDPASDFVQIMAALITVLIVLINVQHLRDRREPGLPGLLTLRDWIHTLERENAPVRVGAVSIPETLTARQRASTMRIIGDTFTGTGHFAFRSPTSLLFYERAGAAGETPAHLLLQASTGGVVGRGRCLPGAPDAGADTVDRLVADGWVTGGQDTETVGETSGEAGVAETDWLCRRFRNLFPDGIVFDLTTLDGARDMRALEPNVLATALPVAATSLERGQFVAPLADRWLTAVYDRAQLRMLLVLPAEPDDALVRRWLRIGRSWQVSRGRAPAKVVSHA